MSLDAPRRRYTEQEIAGAVLAVKDNMGYVKPTAEKLGLRHQTLRSWVTGRTRSSGAATRGVMLQKAEQSLLEGYLELAIASQKQALAGIADAKSRDATIVSGISYDKYLLGTGRPTSRNESYRVRYVEPGALRAVARKVMDMPALPVLALPDGDHTPKVAGEGEKSYPLRELAGSKAKTSARKKRSPSKRTKRTSADVPAGKVISNPTETQIQGRITQNAADSSG